MTETLIQPAVTPAASADGTPANPTLVSTGNPALTMQHTSKVPTDGGPIDIIHTMTMTQAGKTITLESGRFARTANGAVLVTCGDTQLLVTACASKEPRPNIDFFPLLCDFEEKLYSVGRIPGGYIKREGRPSEKSVLICRLMDRPIRPLWPDGYRNDVQVVSSILSSDATTQYDVLAILGASVALELAGLPFQGPLGAVRIGQINGELIINPTFQESEKSTLDLVVAGTADSIMMVEAGAEFIPEELMLKAIALAHDAIREQVKMQEAFTQAAGVTKAAFVFPHDLAPVEAFVNEHCFDAVEKAYHNFDREARQTLLADTKKAMKEAYAALADDHPVKAFISTQTIDYLGETFKSVEKKVMRAMVLNEGVRADGRKIEEVRPISCEVGITKRAHGTALFTRGSTQVLSVTTLGSPGDKQTLDGVDPATEKRWMHHYAFPPYSVGEVRPLRAPGRREVGHGALAERGIAPALPDRETFPYTLRVNSEVLESNGSSSMASTCATSLSLMDAGVPLKTHISGIAMGLVKEGEKFVVLSDIQGVEDFLGDMDFKVTGNEEGITALQMDIKIKGISVDIMRLALDQAKVGRLHILNKMKAALAEPRTVLSPYAPRILSLKIDPEQIGMVIGPGGKNIRAICEQTGATIDIEDDGLVNITAVGEGGEKAYEIVYNMTRKISAGDIFKGKVVRIIPIGAFVELTPGRDGMVHISQIAHDRVNAVEDVLTVGDEVLVKVREIDDQNRINLTIKGIDNDVRAEHGFAPLYEPTPEEQAAQREAAMQARRERGDDEGGYRGGGRGGYGGGGGRGGDRGGRGGGGGGRGRY